MSSAQRILLLGAAVIFGAFGITALVFRFNDLSDDTLSVIAGVAAYVFLAFAAVVLLRAWRARGGDAAEAARAFVRQHPLVISAVGAPASVGMPEGDIPGGPGAAQANLDVVVSGPEGLARVDLVMVRMGRRWEVLTATLVSDGERLPLREGPSERT